jgi:hypothetical protein
MESTRVSSSTASPKLDSAARKETLPFRVGVEVAREPERPQPLPRLLGNDAFAGEPGDLIAAEAEPIERVDQPADPGHHAIAPTGRKCPGEDLEHGSAPGDPGLDGGVQHRELVTVREQCG